MKSLMKNKYIKKYINLPAPLKASFWFTITSVLQKGISFITVPIFTRLLTAEQFGLFNVYKSWLSIITIFATLSLHAGVFNNGMVKFENDRDTFTSSMQGLSSTITVTLFIIYLLSRNFWNKIFGLPTFLVIILFTEVLFFESLKLWSSKKRYVYKFKNLVIVTISMALINPIVGIGAVLLADNKGIARIVSFAFVQISISIIIYAYNFIKGKKFFVKKYWKFALAFNIPLIPHYLSSTVLSQADRIMINNFIGSDKAGIYSVAYSGSMVIKIIQSSINKSFVPWTYKTLKDKKYDRLAEISNHILIFVGLLVLLLILFAPEAISVLAPEEYHDSVWVVPPVAASVFFMFLYTLFANVEFYFEKNKFIMIASVIAAILNIGLNYLFLPIFGYLVAGYTTLISYIIYSLAHFLFVKKITREYLDDKNIYDYKFILISSIIILLLSLVALFLYNFVILRYIIIAVFLLSLFFNKDKIKKLFKIIK